MYCFYRIPSNYRITTQCTLFIDSFPNCRITSQRTVFIEFLPTAVSVLSVLFLSSPSQLPYHFPLYCFSQVSPNCRISTTYVLWYKIYFPEPPYQRSASNPTTAGAGVESSLGGEQKGASSYRISETIRMFSRPSQWVAWVPIINLVIQSCFYERIGIYVSIVNLGLLLPVYELRTSCKSNFIFFLSCNDDNGTFSAARMLLLSDGR